MEIRFEASMKMVRPSGFCLVAKTMHFSMWNRFNKVIQAINTIEENVGIHMSPQGELCIGQENALIL